MHQLYAVILAAGSSERLGQPKAMVPVAIEKREIPLVKWVVERLEYAGITPIIVTNQQLLVPVTFAVPGRTVVLNPAPEKGRTGSIQCGLATIIANIKGKRGMNVLITPVDRPGFSSSTLEALRHCQDTACPAKDGRGGHPVLITAEDVERIMLAESETPLRDLISPMRINVADNFLHLNIDTPDDLVELKQAALEL
ncbi:MAG TPA: NTP transferase domain-containing protein [Candidatus Thalassarchaeaceae archaeon]|nr:NTP transferase domain-containing protein [Candidatus Thalassarchaeaceae archaeon]HJL59031.1 NTP transferase domain-containing protein [Candidatus Thalassarchaeaceae archaeon]HJM20214.1 NTP transferase domain-containing protein [Candidatus Thalassarchaeaceae archaeon]HJM87134.1 NTP transferase domain-containing protein [Candidatus Thalassarchaeaceae archaeon]